MKIRGLASAMFPRSRLPAVLYGRGFGLSPRFGVPREPPDGADSVSFVFSALRRPGAGAADLGTEPTRVLGPGGVACAPPALVSLDGRGGVREGVAAGVGDRVVPGAGPAPVRAGVATGGRFSAEDAGAIRSVAGRGGALAADRASPGNAGSGREATGVMGRTPDAGAAVGPGARGVGGAGEREAAPWSIVGCRSSTFWATILGGVAGAASLGR
jgi:hypothetical protein